MSTLEKAVGLMKNMPESKIETIYAFIRFINSEQDEIAPENHLPKLATVKSFIGIAQEYANPAFIDQEEGAFERAMAEKHATN